MHTKSREEQLSLFFTRAILFIFAQIIHYVQYNLIVLIAVICIAVVIFLIIIFIDVYKSAFVFNTLLSALQNFENLKTNPQIAPYTASIAPFSVITYVIGTLFHYLLRGKRFLTIKQMVIMVTAVTGIPFLFIAYNINSLLKPADQSWVAPAATLLIGFILWIIIIGFVLAARGFDWLARAIESSNYLK